MALAETRFIHPIPWPDGEIATWRLLGPANLDMGLMIAAVVFSQDGKSLRGVGCRWDAEAD